MRLDGRRESSNVEDRRGMGGGAKAGLGIGGIIMVALFAWLSGGDPVAAVMQQVQQNTFGGNTEVTGNVLHSDSCRNGGCVDGDLQAEWGTVSGP